MAGGMSSRFGGRIKAFAKVGPQGETLIEYSLGQSLPAGFSEIVFIVSPVTEGPFRELFGDNFKGVPVKYALQTFDSAERDRPWGTGQAISVLDGAVRGSFVVCNSDDLYGKEAFRLLCEHLRQDESAATIGYKLIENLSEKGTSNRGIIERGESGEVKSIREVLEISKDNLAVKGLTDDSLASMNIFAFQNEIIAELKQRFEIFKSEHAGDRKIEFFLPSNVSDLIEKGKLKMLVYPSPEKTIGLTYPEDEEAVRRLLSGK